MQKFMTTIAAGLGLVGSIAASQAQYFNYSTVFTPDPIPSNVPGSMIQVNNGAFTGGANAGGAGTDIILSNFAIVSPLTGSTASVNTPYQVALTLIQSNATGTPVGAPQTFSFAGNLTGTISTDTSNLQSVFSQPSTHTFDFGGGSTYNVALKNFVTPGPPDGSSLQGALSAHVTYTGVVGPSGTPETPEPGTMALAFGAGVPAMLLASRRRRRTR